VPLAIKDPVLMLPTPTYRLEQLCSKMRQVTNEVAKSIQELTEQMACFVRGQGKQA